MYLQFSNTKTFLIYNICSMYVSNINKYIYITFFLHLINVINMIPYIYIIVYNIDIFVF